MHKLELYILKFSFVLKLAEHFINVRNVRKRKNFRDELLLWTEKWCLTVVCRNFEGKRSHV